MADQVDLAAKADELERSNRWREGYELLKPHALTTGDPELMWRALRTYYRVGKYLAKDKQEREEVSQEGLQVSERALQVAADHFNIQKWSGILLNWASELQGIKIRIEKSFVIKEHFEKAVRLNGSDATVKHLLGRWCYEVASVGWMSRSIAKAVFAAPPESSYEEALKNFQDAEDTSPGFYCGNWLYLAKTCYQLSKKQEAKQWLTKLLERKTENKEDEEYHEEGKQLMKKL